MSNSGAPLPAKPLQTPHGQDMHSVPPDQKGPPSQPSSLPFPGHTAGHASQYFGSQPMPGQQYHSQSPLPPPAPNMPRAQHSGPPFQGQMPPQSHGQSNPYNMPLNQKNIGNSQLQNHQNLIGQQHPSILPMPSQQKLPVNASMDSMNTSGAQHVSRPPMMGQQNIPGASSLPGQQNYSSQHMMSGPPMSHEHNASGPSNVTGPGQQNMFKAEADQQNMPGPLLPGQKQNLSGPPLSGSPLPGQQNLHGPPLPGQQQNLSGPPLSGSPLPGQQPSLSVPPLTGQQQSLSGPPLSVQQQNLTGPPLPGQEQNLSVSSLHEQRQNVSGPPMPGQQQNISGPPVSGQQQNMSGPPMPGQQQNVSGPPMSGQQQNMSGPTMPGQQQNMSGPTMPGQQQHMPGPPMSGQQQKLSGPPMTGQQNLSGPPLPGQQQNLTGPPLPGQQQNLSGPPLPGQQNLSRPPLPGQQQNLSGPPLPGQQQNLSRPSMHGQQQILPNPSLPVQSNLQGPPLSKQQNYSASPLPGQQNLSGPMLPGQQNLQAHLPGQQNQVNAPNQGYLQSNQMSSQRQYMSGPPLPGQPITNPPGARQPPTSYQQQNYHGQPDMYSGQRSAYQGSGPGTMPGYQPGMQPPQQVKRLDPDQMPSPIQVIYDDQRIRGGDFVTNQKGLVPPLVTTKFLVHDQGNASPRFIRSTMYTIPTSSDIIKQSNVPFGLILSPMARVAEGEYEPPIVNMGEIGPVRCVRCKAYMCPFMAFIDAGRRFQCMFCKVTTEVPPEYFQHLDHTGQRMDRYERPELMLGTYEYLATKDYCRNNTLPKPPALVFLIDVSYNAIKSGLVNLLCAKMKEIIRNLPVDVGQTKTNMKVGFITYNNTVHFYNIKSCLAQPQMMVVGDVQDVFMPLLDGFLCDPEESEVVIDSLMIQIPTMFADTRETETILAPAIQAGLEALKASECVGKLMVFHSSLPIAEAPGKLKNRDDRKLLGTEKEKSVLAPQNNVYNNLGQDCVGAGCSVDLFVFNNSYVDIATIGQVCRLTGGEVYKYTYFQADIDGERLITDILNNVKRQIAFDAVMRIRTSTGIRPTDFFGHFYMSNTTDMDIASIDCDKAVAVEIKHDDKLSEDDGVYIQAALLYTSCSGIRRLRIINLSLKTSSQLAELYRACELDAIINFFSKQSVFKLIESTPKAVKDSLISRCANILAAYRKHCASPSSNGQLILPECMKLLPLYINCLLKSDAISGGPDMTIDDRSFVMQAVCKMPIKESVWYFYPRLIALHDVDPQRTEMPSIIRCSFDKFTDDGAYLLENGIHMFLWLGLALNPQWVQAVFGTPAVAHVDADRSVLPILDNPLNKRINDIIATIRSERHYCMRLTIVRQRDKMEVVLRHFLVEDRGTDGSSSYVDFLCHMHKEIRSLLS